MPGQGAADQLHHRLVAFEAHRLGGELVGDPPVLAEQHRLGGERAHLGGLVPVGDQLAGHATAAGRAENMRTIEANISRADRTEAQPCGSAASSTTGASTRVQQRRR